MKAVATGEITGLLHQWNLGDQAAFDQVFALLYREIRRQALRFMPSFGREQTLSPTALVHEVYLRLVRLDRSGREHNRRQFMSLTRTIMLHQLINYQERKQAQCRGGHLQKVALQDDAFSGEEFSAEEIAQVARDLPVLEHWLGRLQTIKPRAFQVLQMRFFADVSVAQTARELGISPATVFRETNLALAWLKRRLRGGGMPG